jgi:hypothetical protein
MMMMMIIIIIVSQNMVSQNVYATTTGSPSVFSD